ncbi:Protein kinase domain [Dillenia turbinata]|uniref:non-specific serine/threonine protein kinase n=1 Tax=Dillenia turbinata TaxID=194707 RepID=A0AAN8UGM7_9MAGN
MPSRPISPNPNSPEPNPNSNTLFLCITLTASAILFLAILIFLYYLWKSFLHNSKTSPFDSSTEQLKLQRFSFKELRNATNDFNAENSIGKGGSGTVFRGILRDGKSVAVKKLEDLPSAQAEREFQNELQVLGGLRSPYVVALLGYCLEKNKRLLVYEYMPNHSLQESLFNSVEENLNMNMNLNWEMRFQIIDDVARALAFLHLDCDPPVIHGDIKPSNVLLDWNFRAKISDFGLSRVKVEGEFGVDLFSQELGKSQELSGTLAAVSVETPGISTPVESNNEVDFSLALQASSSSKNSRVCCNAKALNLGSLNYNASIANESKNLKSKEISNLEVASDDWNRFVPYDDEYCSVEHSKELNSNASVVVDDAGSAKPWGRDWWWKQDGSGELCSKDYVMEWIGSQICPSENPDWDEVGKCNPQKSNLDGSTQLDMFHTNATNSHLQELGSEDCNKGLEVKDTKGRKSFQKRHRKMQEWWKEEYLSEISKKGSEIKKLKFRWKKGFKLPHFSLTRRLLFRRRTPFLEENQNNCDANGEFSFRGGWKKNNAHSVGSEMWSGDLFSRELSSTTSMRGTLCYVAPEYGGTGYLMEKADIYSFGVLILVIVSGRRPLHVLSSPMKLEKANLISWCRHLAHAGNVLELVDERLKDMYNRSQASLCINLALACLQRMPELRPDIGDIVKILRGEMDLPPLPFEFSPSPPSKISSRSKRKKKADGQ